MKKLACFAVAMLAVFSLAIIGCSHKPLVITEPEPIVINFPEATVHYMSAPIISDGGQYIPGEKIFTNRTDYSMEISVDDRVALYTRMDALVGTKSKHMEVVATQGEIFLAPMSRPRKIIGPSEFTATVTGFEHKIKMMEATRLMLNILAENVVAIEEGYVMPRENICNEGEKATDERYEPSLITVVFIVSRTAERMADSFLKDGAPYLEFGQMLEANRIIKDYLQAQHNCLKDGNAVEALEKGQNLIERVLVN